MRFLFVFLFMILLSNKGEYRQHFCFTQTLFLLLLFFVFNLKVNTASPYSTRECTFDEDSINFKCYNGGLCQQIDLNSTSNMKICM